MEQPDVSRALVLWPSRGLAFEIPCQAPAITEQRNPLAVRGQPFGLLDREPRLAGARAANHLEPTVVLQAVECRSLIARHLVDALLMLLGDRQQRRLAKQLAGQHVNETLQCFGSQQFVAAAVAFDPSPHTVRRIPHVRLVEYEVARTV